MTEYQDEIIQSMKICLWVDVTRGKTARRLVQPVVEAISLINRNWTETRARLKSFEEDWNAPGMEGYDLKTSF